MRYFLELSYKGTRYHGWQRQPSAPSVQQTVEDVLSTLLREPVSLTGAGRTDTGVHASFYVAHFDTSSFLSPDLLHHANSMLPEDIALHAFRSVPDSAHARFSASERTYTYFITSSKDPFRAETAWWFPRPLDVDKMNEAASSLLTHSDFTSFAKLHSANKTNICHVTRAEWDIKKNEIFFLISSDRFLRNMVRSLVGTLVDVGRGKISPSRFTEILHSHDLSLSSSSAPAHGLFLSNIVYSA